MTITEIISAIGLIGLGGLLKSIFDFAITNRKRKAENKDQLKETRYKAIMLLSYSFINYQKEAKKLLLKRPNILTKQELFNALHAEWINMTLFASDKVILAMKEFLENKNLSSFNKLTIAMRKDLYGISTRIKIENLLLTIKD